MKTKVACILMVLLASVAAAQDNQPNIFGIRAGVNFQNINGKEADGSKTDNDLKTGFNVGVTAQLPVAPDFYFQTGLLYTTKGAVHKETFAGQTIESSISLGYIELPLHLLYKPVVGAGHLILGFGPYIGYGITGKAKYETSGAINTSGEYDVRYDGEVTESEFDTDEIVFKPLDAGADIFFGYEFANRVSVQLNSQLGLVNINPEYVGFSDDKTSYKNTGFGISVGYLF